MSYRNVIAYLNGRFLVKGVKHGAILNVDAVANLYGVDIATKHSVEPHAAIVAHHHIAYDCAVVGKKTVFADYWRISSY